MATETITFTKIEHRDLSFTLNSPLAATIENRPLSDGSDFWVIESRLSTDLTDITGWGKTREEAISNFNCDFCFVYTDIACEDDKNLTLDARELKKAILEMVEA